MLKIDRTPYLRHQIKKHTCIIRRLEKLNKPCHVHYDQLEELYTALHNEKKKLNADKVDDRLDAWCEVFPSDLECRMYSD